MRLLTVCLMFFLLGLEHIAGKYYVHNLRYYGRFIPMLFYLYYAYI